MENASKALIIAGAIMIAIMVISLGVIMYNKMGSSAKKMANMDEQEISAFNAKITPYVGESIAGSQVNALLQYCLSVNLSKKNEIIVEYRNTSSDSYATILNSDSTSFNKLATAGTYYKVESIYSSSGLITKLQITKITKIT